eukprot:CAMPEP_0172418998 /NCGR_PEP_ID=MMETSP1064-20121228/5434_1 /TAXON_ID=202472 /ORGANISM="Aulacoseira subarctica , Strain CCAP 1002/5" /LENGTH=640 /DNA_ID=CAMNT_0013158215 /DNA_START=107 /DNA_END=2029 /DNA_ORIENTATION=-
MAMPSSTVLYRPYLAKSLSGLTSPMSKHVFTRSYIVLPSNFQEFVRFSIDGLRKFIFGNSANDIKEMKRLNIAHSNTGQLSLKDRLRDLYHSKASKWRASTSAKSVIIARRTNIFLAKAKREKGSMIKDFNRSIIGAAIHRRSTMLRRRTTTNSIARRANIFLAKAARRAILRIKNKGGTATLHDEQEAKKSDVVLLVHPDSKFDSDGFPLTSYVTTDSDVNSTSTSKRYINPWSISSCQHEPFLNYIKWKWHRTFYTKDKEPKSLEDFKEKTQQYISSSHNQHIFPRDIHSAIKSSATSPSFANDDNRIKCTWVGHATCLVQMHGVSILTDPVFSDITGPTGFGYKRYVPPSHTIEELGAIVDGIIDVVCLSHDHYDHLDYTSIYDLVQSDDVQVKKWCVPLGMKKWLLDNFGSHQKEEDKGIDENDVHEMEWWEDAVFEKMRDKDSASTSFRITSAPCQHWSSRSPFDRDTRLWCSWAVETLQKQQPDKATSTTSRLSFYFAGDTGKPSNGFPLHKQIGDRLGPFDLSALPIGAYMPDNFIGDSHVNPSEAREIHKDLRSKLSLGIHWGTFAMGDEPFYEPAQLLRNCWDAVATEDTNDCISYDTDSFLLIYQGAFVLSVVATPLETSNQLGTSIELE